MLSRERGTPPTPTDWDYLLEERTAIMYDSGMTSERARALAIQDTIRTHGPRTGRAQ